MGIAFSNYLGWLRREHTPIKYGHGQVAPALPGIAATGSDPAVSGFFTRSWDDRLWMFQRRWLPKGQVEATLMILHGTVDHSGVYAELGKSLADSGIAVFALDMRGWGLSDGESMYFHNVDTFTADVEAAYELIHGGPRFASVTARFILGKSLGGLVAAFTVAKHPEKFSGLLGLSGAYQVDPRTGIPSSGARFVLNILSALVPKHPEKFSGLLGLSGAYQVDPRTGIPSSGARFVLNILSALVPKLPMKKLFDPTLIVSDAAALEAWKADPLCCKDKLRLGYLTELLRCTHALEAKVATMTVPMLMMIGSEDKVVTLAGHKLMIERSAGTDTKLEIYEGGRHNLLAEPNIKSKVISDIRSWILEHGS
eukprot:TRINITY_DN36251_c0_g1_i2.p1 TRINITY_DN36251_c0_g1~~TRINITY_DN36251_c0_g1_i2.p1  ORF type:complete len:368 (-),score=57.12 TRINITY_DN36251_c0_g1_i2:42-1145(-)